jgi:hypothetical protein
VNFGLRRNLNKNEMRELAETVFPGACDDDPKSTMEVWARILGRLREADPLTDILILPGSSPETALKYMGIFRQHLFHGLSYRPSGQYDGTISIFVEKGNAMYDARDWQRYSSRPLDFHEYPIETSFPFRTRGKWWYNKENAGRHLELMSEPNLRTFIKDVDAAFDRADASR